MNIMIGEERCKYGTLLDYCWENKDCTMANNFCKTSATEGGNPMEAPESRVPQVRTGPTVTGICSPSPGGKDLCISLALVQHDSLVMRTACLIL